MKSNATRSIVIATIVVVALVSGIAVAFAGSPVSGTITLNATDGPAVAVTFSGQSQLNTANPFPDSNTVDITATEGNATFSSPGPSNVSVNADELEGTRTRLTGIDATNDLTVDPDDKNAITVGGGIDSVAFQDATVGDGSPEFDFSASSSGSITFRNVGASSGTIGAVASDGTALGGGAVDSSGTVTITGLTGSATDVELRQTADPQIDALDPDRQNVTGPQTINVTVSDADFTANGGDNLTVEFSEGGTVFATRTLSSAGTVSAQFPSPVNGQNDYSVQVTDAFGNSISRQSSFTLPRFLEFRQVSSPNQLIGSSANATVRFFGFDGDVIKSQAVTNGTVDLQSLPVEQRYFVSITSDNFQDRTVVIDSLFDQRNIFLLADTVDTVLIDFALDDRTGRFSGGDNTQLLLERAIVLNGSSDFRRVVGSDIDATGSAENLLERGVRYRLIVRTDERTRVLGSFTPQTSQRQTLEIGDLEFGFDITESFKLDANRTESDLLRASYQDPAGETDEVKFSIVNAENSSDVFVEETFTDTQNISLTNQLSGADANKSANLEYEITRGGETQTGVLPMAASRGSQNLGIPLDSDWKGRVSIGMILLFGSVFTSASVRLGAVAVPALGGVLLLIGWMPVGIGAASVGAALSLGVAYSAITNRGTR
jgi:hypothetical protein